MNEHQKLNTDVELLHKLKAHWNLMSSKSGCLVQRFDGAWHYGVALSDTSAISWGPSRALHLYDKGCLEIHSLTKEFKEAIQVPYLSKEEIFENLIASIPAFHQKWKYGIQGWNCEHWARLVVSGQPISYQTKEQSFGIFDAFGTLYFRADAIEKLNKYKY